MLTVRNREKGFAKTFKVWNHKVIDKALDEQTEVDDIYITKYPTDRLVDMIILDFDDEDDPNKAFDEANKVSNYLKINGLNSFIVESGSKGNHLYIQISPTMFKDTDFRKVADWNSFFNAFVCFLIHDSSSTYETLDKINFSAGLNGNIRVVGSKHPKTGRTCRIVKGSFKETYDVTKIQCDALRKAFLKCEIVEQDKQEKIKKARVLDSNDPIANNDLRQIFKDITGDIKLYPKGYGYCCCPVHGDKHPSLLVTKEWFNCASCNFKGNIYTLRKMGFVEFDSNGEVRY